ncbi:MAG TPA: enolase C-terminal domain-like protein [Edaphobacter sp.]|nr:enolase C-terminal domain-like protein [Edaphobacter sp.]
MRYSGDRIRSVNFSAFTVPTDAPEADGTFAWNSTTLVLVEISAANEAGVGYTYGNGAVASFGHHLAQTCVLNQSPFDIPMLHASMLRAVRNDGSRGIAAMAISALDIALWDLKARLLETSVTQLLGRAQASIPVYGSGGFTSYTNAQLTKQFSGWAAQGIGMMKMKVGSDSSTDPARVKAARKAIGSSNQLFVDANGAYTGKQALALADIFAEQSVTWFEEPVSSDHLETLHLIRERAPAGMAIAAGEYGYDSFYFRRMLQAGAVDVLQLDATRCCGFTGFLEGAAIAASFGTPLSAHCAPTLHMHVGCAVPTLKHIEYFHDHVRIEQMLFDGFIAQKNGSLTPDSSRSGLGLTLKRKDAERYAA